MNPSIKKNTKKKTLSFFEELCYNKSVEVGCKRVGSSQIAVRGVKPMGDKMFF
jgi:hypothetical protein